MSKLKLITELYKETLEEISATPQEWISFLECSSMNYKYPFNDQVLIYAQKPTAIACAKIEAWNKQVGRWVNRGAKGIALLTEDNGYSVLRYVFDVADTNSKDGKSFRLWSVPKPYENDIIESLENKYGDLEDNTSLAFAIKSVAKIIVEDNITDYLEDLKSSSLLTEKEMYDIFSSTLENSVAYSIMKRCGLKPSEYFNEDSFSSISKLSDYEIITRFGIATSEISEMGISEIYSTIKKLRVNEIKKIRTFDLKDNLDYANNERRRNENESNLHSSRGLPDTGLNNSREEHSSERQIRSNEVGLLEEPQETSIYNSTDGQQTISSLDNNSRTSNEPNGTNNERIESSREYHGGIESNRPNEMDGTNGQFEELSRRNDNERTNLRLNEYHKDSENHYPYVVVEEKVNQILSSTPHFKKSNKEIVLFFNKEKDKIKQMKFLKELFNPDYTGVIVDDKMFGYKAFDNGVLFWKGNFLTRDTETFLSWDDLTYNFNSMVLLNQFNLRVERLPSVNEQLSLFDNETLTPTSGLEFTQEFVDKYLTDKNTNTKYEIYKQFQESLSTQDNINYLKNMYGMGGASHTVKGSGIGINYDAKGITFNRGYFDPSSKQQFFNWNYIAKRISTLIQTDRYLTDEELSKYDEWLNKKNISTEFVDKVTVNEQEELFKYLFDKYDISNYEIVLKNNEIDTVIINQEKYPVIDAFKHIIKILEDYEENYIEDDLSKIDDELHNQISKERLEVIDKKFNYYDSTYKVVGFDNTDEEMDDLAFIKDIKSDNSSVEPVGFIKYLLDEQNEELANVDKEKSITPTKLQVKKVSNKITTFDIHPEIDINSRSQYKIVNDDLGVGTVKEKFNRNIDAIKVLKKCEEENRFATPQEQEILKDYVGWGGLADAFDNEKSNWSNEYHILKNLLDNDEYEQARASTTTAFYTPPVVIRSIYKALENMGLKNGNVLEPACGTGNFIGMLPDTLKDCKLYGVEIDSISGRIARQLYQKSSIAVQGYETTNLPDSFFDVAISNVPFNDFKVSDKKYDKHNFYIHDYYFAKTLDKVRPGGVIAFITSKGTLDKANSNVRKYIAQRADLIGAIRLPNDTFLKNAGTQATADIIFLQKRDSITDIMPDWVYTATDDNGIRINNYFIDNPDMILGDMKMVPGIHGIPTSACVSNGNDLEEQLSQAIQNIQTEIKDYEFDDIGEEDKSIEADLTVRNFSYTIKDDIVYYRENSRMYPQELAMTTENRVRGLIEIRDCVRTLLEYQTEDFPEEDIKSQQLQLNRLYDSFTKKYGLINSRGNNIAFSNDSSYYLLCSLEMLDEKGNLKRKADMFTKRTIKPKIEITSVDNAQDALIVSISEKAKVDLNFMQKLSTMDMDKMIKDLEGEIFNVPIPGDPNVWVTADEYLSGNVREKLKVAEEFAKEDEKFNINVKYLKEVQPKDLSASEISVKLGTTWIPPQDIKDFIVYLLTPSDVICDSVKVNYQKSTAEWYISCKNYDRGNVKANKTYGTGRANAYKIIEDSLNLKDTRIFDYYEDENGKKIAELNKKETAIAQAKQEQIKLAFEEWIWKDPLRRERLVRYYNDTFNCIRPREYDGSHIKFDGMSPEITLRKHQVNAIGRILYGGNTLLAHEVGAGKTFEMVAAAMESKRLGLCNKSLFVVPNHIVEQFGQEFLQLYPSANILVTTKKDFETANRKKFCSRIATGDYDAVIISHSQFEKIPMSVERQEKIIRQQINDITLGITDLKNNNAERFSIKQMEKTKKNLEAKLEKLNSTARKDSVITFEELGVDRIFVDEAHYFKNLFLYTKMRNVSGIAQTEAQKSSDLYMKCRYLDELTDGKGIVFATGTPISNSMVELYTMQRYLQFAELENRGLQHFDSWASTFGETTTAIELAPEGTGYRAKTRFSKFFNLPELMAMFKEVADIQTSDMLNLPVPKANYHNVVIKPSDVQKELVKELSERAEKVRNKMVTPNEDNMLKITNDGRKLALDQRLIDEMLPDFEDSKVATCANNIYDIWERTKENRSAQLVFCDLSTPHNDGKFNVYDDLKQKLIERGISEDEIEFIHNANTDARKQDLFNKVRQGKVRVLMGSTQKMGAGTNCQDRLIALHDLDCPWRPSDLIQRSGRIIRQGNQNKEVDIYRYVTEGTFDAYLYQLVENKQRFISQIMTSKTPVRFAEDIDEVALSYAEVKALAAGNPDIIEKTELDTVVAKLKLLKQTHLSQIYEMEDKIIKHYPTEIKRLESIVEKLKADLELYNQNVSGDDTFKSITIQDITYIDRKSAGEKIIELCKNKGNPAEEFIGEYKGFKMYLMFDTTFKNFKIYLKNQYSHCCILGEDPSGNITRIDNAINDIEYKIERAEKELDEVNKQFENAKEEVKRPFPQEQELKEKSKRLDELNIKLNLNQKDKEIIDDEKEEINDSQMYKKDYER